MLSRDSADPKAASAVFELKLKIFRLASAAVDCARYAITVDQRSDC